MAPTMIPPASADQFLASIGWEGARIEPLAGDASFRRYFRVTRGNRTAVLMDAPPPKEEPKEEKTTLKFAATKKSFHIGGDVLPKQRDLGRFVRWPRTLAAPWKP